MANIPDTVVVLLVIIGSGAMVVIGKAIHMRHYGNRDADEEAKLFQIQNEQKEYMRLVRMQNLAWADREARDAHRAVRQGRHDAEPRYDHSSNDTRAEYMSASASTDEKGKGSKVGVMDYGSRGQVSCPKAIE
ncbi:hypothetical protein MMC28_003295 [Mycoblastus sanguinarius]|nr:hypothetical protein [Mycoblastus sanguinarius]